MFMEQDMSFMYMEKPWTNNIEVVIIAIKG